MSDDDDEPPFDGATFSHGLDEARLATQLGQTYAIMFDGRWRSIPEISAAGAEGTDQGISARLRDFRKEKNKEAGYACFALLRRRRGLPSAGLWEYRLVRDQRGMTEEDWRILRGPPDDPDEPQGPAYQPVQGSLFAGSGVPGRSIDDDDG